MERIRHSLTRTVEREWLQPDVARAVRCTVAFMAPLLAALRGHLPVEVAFAALAAQGLALIDVRGAYVLRLTLLLAMTGVLTAAAGLGALASASLPAALLATCAVAAGTGLWRHLSSEYGPSLAATSSLVFFIALLTPGGRAAAGSHAEAALAGGLWGAALQVALWPFRPQHPLRRIVAESWVAAADLFAAAAPREGMDEAARHAALAEREAALRSAIDKAAAAIAGSARRPRLIRGLEELNLAASRLALRVGALPTALESVSDPEARAEWGPALQPVFVALGNLARTAALAAVSRQPSHFAAADVRVRRLTHLLAGLRARAAAAGAAVLADVLRDVEDYLPEAGRAVAAVNDRADERMALPLELFDLETLRLRPLASALNLGGRVDRTLVRFTLRIAFLTVGGVLAVTLHPLPHGYWLPFTMVVVLQPDYGSTRQRAGQRLLGTFVGSLLASLLLWLHLPFAALMAATAATSFFFGYWLKRSYGLAVVFITLFVVLLTEASGPATLALTAERLGSTLAGGGLALLAALAFWPVWERERFPPILAAALRANRGYLARLAGRLSAGEASDADLVRLRRAAERANAEVFASLQRMSGDPKNRRERLAQAAALANGNQRLTRILNLLALQLEAGAPLPHPALPGFARGADAALEALAGSIVHHAGDSSGLEAAATALERLRLPVAETAGAPRAHLVFSQLARATTELVAMLLLEHSLVMADRG